MYVTENAQFRSLLHQLGGANIEPKDIPHRTKITRAIFERYYEEEEILRRELQVRTFTETLQAHVPFLTTVAL